MNSWVEKLKAKDDSISFNLDEARKDQKVIKAKLKTLEVEEEYINSVIASLEEELCIVIQKRDKVYDKIRELRNKLEEGVMIFLQQGICNLTIEPTQANETSSLSHTILQENESWLFRMLH